VNLPPSLGSHGRRERRYFKGRSPADEFCRQQRIRLENYGTASTVLPAGKAEEAVAAFERLRGTGASLTEAVAYFVEAQERHATSVTFGVLMHRFRQAKQHRRAQYKTQIEQTQRRFSELDALSAVDITPDVIDGIAAKYAPSRRNGFLRVIRAAFNWAIRKEWCRCKNPVLRLDFTQEKRNTQILTNDQVEALLNTSVRVDLSTLPYLLFTIFAGIRPAEVGRINWADHVDLEESLVRVPEEHSKTDTRRVVEMQPGLIAWLDAYRLRGGKMTGRVAPPNLRIRVRAVRKQAGIDTWPADAPRRTFASCHLAMFNNVGELCRLLGHTSSKMLWEHYYKAVTKKQAEAFWQICPVEIESRAAST
jgi:integrase